MFKVNPLVLRLILFILIPSLVSVILVLRYLESSLPEVEGNKVIEGIDSTVSISRDNHGVAYIEAESDHDVYFTMGYVHAQDRLWQLEIQRRIAKGRLSEIFGKAYLDYDIWMRTLKLKSAAQDALLKLNPEARASLQAYASGVNAFLSQNQPLPPEFKVFGITPEKWEEVDSLAWYKVFALGFSQSMWAETEFYAAQKMLPTEQLSVLFPSYPEGAPVNVEFDVEQNKDALVSLLNIKEGLEEDLQIGGEYVGSNAWAVSGQHTKDGVPIIAADPHMGLQAPSFWYVVSQKGKKLNVSGMSLVGLPLVIFGKNEKIAWAGTSMTADTQDLFYEKVDPSNTKKYLDGDQWREFETRTEKILIKEESPAFLNEKIQPVEVEVRSTVRGPIISDVVSGFDYPVSLSWTSLQFDDTTYNALFELSYAQNWDEFKQALSQMVAPTLNLLYADTDDNIGFLGAGAIPIRNTGDGRFPVPGWEAQHKWIGVIPAEHMPMSLNPENGYIVSANNKVIDDSYPYFISHDWAPPSRAQRIEQLLQQNLPNGVSMENMQNMQADTVDLGMYSTLNQALDMLGTLPQHEEVISLLRAWDGDMSKDSVAGSIAYIWLELLSGELFQDDLADYWNGRTKRFINSIHDRIGFEHIQLALADKAYNWCDYRSTKTVESCNVALAKSLESALKRLKKLKGSNMNNWKWGELHYSVYAHMPLSEFRMLQGFFERRQPAGGTPGSINVSNARFDQSKGYAQNFGAGFRQIIQMNMTEKQHLYMNSMGQSSHIMSEHYDDMVLPFANVEYYSLTSDFSSNTQKVLILTPAEKQGSAK
ncbi:hypothetical protein BB427_16335 [Pseudoalteromonas sp. BMB]|nr:hypothetical protein BB427_16335 [Pseudoalteromonas sp. BMB]